jgi:hypothetical protein
MTAAILSDTLPGLQPGPVTPRPVPDPIEPEPPPPPNPHDPDPYPRYEDEPPARPIDGASP